MIDYHGKDGPQVVSDVRGTQLAGVFVRAGQELGYNYVDANSGDQIGRRLLNFAVKLLVNHMYQYLRVKVNICSSCAVIHLSTLDI